jgi:hypothetical protein
MTVAFQADLVMAPRGESIAAGLLTNEAGASLEVGGAHWFAECGGDDAKADAESTDKVNGQIQINVCSC